MILESDEEMTRRDAVLLEVRNIFIKWVHYVSVEVPPSVLICTFNIYNIY